MDDDEEKLRNKILEDIKALEEELGLSKKEKYYGDLDIRFLVNKYASLTLISQEKKILAQAKDMNMKSAPKEYLDKLKIIEDDVGEKENLFRLWNNEIYQGTNRNIKVQVDEILKSYASEGYIYAYNVTCYDVDDYMTDNYIVDEKALNEDKTKPDEGGKGIAIAQSEDLDVE